MNITENNKNGFRLDGKAAIITGGASGIGRSIAQRFAASGASVHIVDLDRSEAERTAVGIARTGGKVEIHQSDISSQQQIKATYQQIFRQESIHILVNNAGIAHIGNLESTKEDEFEKVFRVNVKGLYNSMLACIEHLKLQGGGVILNLASIAASAGLADRFAYSASKGAVVSMTYSVAKDYLPYNVRCNCISPARVHTPFVDGFLRKHYPGSEQQMFEKLSNAQPVGRMAKPEEVASLALFLCSDEAVFITGVDYPIDGGFMNLRG